MIVECTKCEAFVETEPAGEYQYLRRGDTPSGRYVLLRCKKCDGPILVWQDNVGNIAEGDIWDAPVTLFPVQRDRASKDVPPPLGDSYDEAAACSRAKAYTATAIMYRRTLEGVCDAKDMRERSLARSLAKLRDSGLIDDRLFEWADALRIAGNEAAHDVGAKVSRDDARDILDFTNAILEYLFSFQEKFNAFVARRSNGTGFR